MKLTILITILFLFDIYFYLGTASVVNKLFKNELIYKLIYWAISTFIYLGIIYIVITYNKKDAIN